MKDQEYNEFINGPSKAIPPGWTVLDGILLISIKRLMTCEDFANYFQKEYDIKILIISSNSKSIIMMYMASKAKKKLKIEEIYEKDYGLKKGQNYLWLNKAGN